MPRFMRKGKTKVRWVPTIAAATLVPTAAETTAGTDLTPQIAEISGFTFSNSPIATPDLSTDFVSTIPGENATEDSSMTFYEDTVTNPIKTVLAKGSTGNIAIFPTGIAGANPAAGDKCDVWPVTISANVRTYTAGNEAAMYRVDYASRAEPKFDLTVT